MSEPSATAVSPRRIAWAVAPGVLLAGVAGGIAFPILPIVGERAGLPLWYIGVILAANRAVRVLLNPFVGRLADRIGSRRTLLGGLIIQIAVMGLYLLGVVIGHPGVFFMLGRLLHGVGSSAVFVSGQALALRGAGSGHGRAAGTVRAALVIGIPAGLTLGGLMAEAWSDAAAFEAAIGAMAAAALVAAWLVPDLRVESRAPAKLAESLRALANRRLAAVGTLNFVASFGANGLVLTTLALLVHERGLALFSMGEQGTSGALMGLMTVASALAMPWMGHLGDRKRMHAAVGGFGVLITIPALLAMGLASSVPPLAVGLVVLGLGDAALGPSLLALVGAWVAPGQRGQAVGLLQLCGDLGGALGPVVGSALLATSTRTPYLVSAALITCALPVAVALVRAERADAGRIA